MSDHDLDFLVTGSGTIELAASSKDNYWIVKILKDGNIIFLKNMKPVEAFPSTPLTKKLIKATESVHKDAVAYLAKCWEQTPPKPWDDAEGREAWWSMKKKVESF